MKKKIIYLFLLIILCLSFVENANAATGSMSVSVNSSSVVVGNKITMNVSIKGEALAAGVTYVTVDDTNIVQLTGYEGKVTQNLSNGKHLWESSSESGSNTISFKLIFTSKNAGSTTIHIKTENVSNAEGDTVSISDGNPKTITVTINNPAKSGDANLSNITLSKGELYPSFSYDITSYTVTYEYAVDEVVVGYKTSGSGATAKINGSNKLNVGDNKRTITVTAENGSTKTYTINLIRAQEDGTLPDGTNYYENKKSDALGIEIDEKKYMILDDFSGINIPEGFEEDVVSYNGFDVPVLKTKKTGMVMVYVIPVDANDSTISAKWLFYDEEKKELVSSYPLSTSEIFDQTHYLLYGDEEEPEHEVKPESKPDSLLDDPVLLYTILATLAILFIVIVCLQISILSAKRKK